MVKTRFDLLDLINKAPSWAVSVSVNKNGVAHYSSCDCKMLCCDYPQQNEWSINNSSLTHRMCRIDGVLFKVKDWKKSAMNLKLEKY